MGCLLFSMGSSNRQHNIAWRGWESQEKLYFPFKKSVKDQTAPLGQSVLTNFVANSPPKQVPSAQSGVVSRLRNRCGEEKVTGYFADH